MKKTNYFSHDSNARNDEKMIAVRMRLGAEGYGVFFMLLERLREEKDYMCVKDYPMLSFDLRVDVDVIKSVVEDFDLFEFTENDKCFFSNSFNNRMGIKDDAKKRRSEAGKKGMKARWGDKSDTKKSNEKDKSVTKNDNSGDNNAITMLSKNITSKVKESKVNKDNIEVVPTSKSEMQASRTHADDIDYKKLIEYFNLTTQGIFGEVRYPISDNRKKSIRARIRGHGKEAFVEVIQKAINSNFLKGDNSRGFTATFDWLIKPTNFEKTLSGNYDNKNGNNESRGNDKDADRLEWLANYAENAFRRQ